MLSSTDNNFMICLFDFERFSIESRFPFFFYSHCILLLFSSSQRLWTIYTRAAPWCLVEKLVQRGRRRGGGGSTVTLLRPEKLWQTFHNGVGVLSSSTYMTDLWAEPQGLPPPPPHPVTAAWIGLHNRPIRCKNSFLTLAQNQLAVVS